MTYPALAALAFSLAMIVLLWRGDPKRRRTAGLRIIDKSPAKRRLVVAAAMIPGLILALCGDSAAFLVWLGGCTIGGWGIAQFQPKPIKVKPEPVAVKSQGGAKH